MNIIFYLQLELKMKLNPIYLSLFLVTFGVVHFLGHSEIGHFDHSVVGQQNISSRQVSVKDFSTC